MSNEEEDQDVTLDKLFEVNPVPLVEEKDPNKLLAQMEASHKDEVCIPEPSPESSRMIPVASTRL